MSPDHVTLVVLVTLAPETTATAVSVCLWGSGSARICRPCCGCCAPSQPQFLPRYCHAVRRIPPSHLSSWTERWTVSAAAFLTHSDLRASTARALQFNCKYTRCCPRVASSVPPPPPHALPPQAFSLHTWKSRRCAWSAAPPPPVHSAPRSHPSPTTRAAGAHQHLHWHSRSHARQRRAVHRPHHD